MVIAVSGHEKFIGKGFSGRMSISWVWRSEQC